MLLPMLFSGGDVLLKIPATISFGEIAAEDPDTDPGPYPFRTIVMLISIVVHLGLSGLTHVAFTRKMLPLKYDFFNSFKEL